MKSTLDTLEGLGRKLNIEIPANRVSDTFIKMYKGIQKNATIKGFRKGKAPLAAIKSMYADRVKQDVLQELVNESYQKALEDHSLDPITQPKIDLVNFDEQGSFTFTAEMEVRPEIQLNKIEGLKIEKELLEVDEKQVDESIKNIQTNFKEYSPVLEDRPAKEGDFLKIDFEGFINDQPLSGGKADNHILELGSKSFIPGFEEGLIGAKPGDDKTLDISFPIDYHVEDLKGQKVIFKVKVKEINKLNLPELNDEFAQKVSSEFKTLEELKKVIKEDIEDREKERIEEDLKNRVLKVLAQENPLEVPKALVEDQKNRLVQDVESRLKKQGFDAKGINEYKQKWAKDFEDTATFMVQSSFLIDKISQKHQLHAKAPDIEAKFNKMAAEFNVDIEQIREFYKDKNKMSALLYQIMEEKVVGFLLEKSQINEVPKSKLTE
ncbi:MAG: trigger factor [Bdellovibrionaceae bacterium]|nr:trigger factor [Pseudobdellovibrionaceae bacterium]